jgi:uncharacterized protein (TIGR02145 family)
MKIRITFFTFLASVALCLAQTINISGIVKNNEGSGIEGVTVRLGKADRATTTGSDGSFRLTENATGAKLKTNHAAFRNDCPVILEDNRLFFNVMKHADVKVMVYDFSGRLLFSHSQLASSRKHSIALPRFRSGIHIYRVSMNNEQFTFKSVAGIAINRSAASSWKKPVIAKQAKATAQIDDALLFTKEGYQLYRLSVTKSDTSDIQITMVPLVTGTVTDADGNVYKTVRIGNQIWTAENLRTTKYNDGKSIPQGSAYWFYKNTTDAAEKKKWGALYNFDAVNTGKLAPTGWHVPTDAEWDTMQNYLIASGYNYDGTIGNKNDGALYQNKIAKSLAAKTDWLPDTTDTGAIGNDLSKNNAGGFSALPAGYRYYTGEFMGQNEFGYWWTATQHDASFAWYRYLWNLNRDLYRSDRVKTLGCSVRLVRLN